MRLIQRVLNYFNPMANIGEREYSFAFPFVASIFFCMLSEVYALSIAKNPLIVGAYVIFIHALLIIYFAFRDGFVGGFTASVIALLYYAYILDTRHYVGPHLSSGIDTTIALGVMYFLLAGTIGWLKQTIDAVVERESYERKRLQSILEQLPVGVLIADADGKILDVNTQIEEILDTTFPSDYRLGRDLLLSVTTNGRPLTPSQAPLVHAIAGKSIQAQEYQVTRKDGEIISLQVSASPIRNKKGEIVAAAQIITDITRQKELEQQKDDFIDMASHELKTPLTSMKVFAQVLQKKLEEKNDTESTKLIATINAQINTLASLVSALLDVTRMEKGTLQVKKERFYVREVAEDVKTNLQAISGHTIRIDWNTKLPVVGDKEKIRQVLTNLVTNAIKYSPEDKEIVIGSQKNNDLIEIFVQDFGIGISRREQKKIFERFYQVAEHSTYPGLGLGLYISARILSQHGGKIWVESKKGHGAIFYFSLPVYVA